MKAANENECQGDLRGADFSGRDLSGVIFSQADLYEASFRGARLEGAQFVNCTAERANFEQARCRAMQAQNTNFYGAKFAQANLTDTVLRYCVLAGADLQGAILDRITITLDCNSFERVVLDRETATRLAFLIAQAASPLRQRMRAALGERECERLESFFAG